MHRNYWFPLHEYAIDHWDNWQPDSADDFLRRWVANIPGESCNCPENWAAHSITIRTDAPEHFFADANAAHNIVSESINKRALTLGQAYGIWRRRGKYETELDHLADNRIDVVIPYCDADKQFVDEAIRSIVAQEHVVPTVHVVFDNSHDGPMELKRERDFAVGPRARIIRYHTLGRMGPYRIANAVSLQCKTRYLANQDADDHSTPDRLWRQLATMQRFGYEMTGGAMRNYQDGESATSVIESGAEFTHVPVGRCINSVRTMSLAMFRRLRGFTPHMCSMDFDFDNRAHFAGVSRFFGTDVIGHRRLHGASLTNGGEYAHRSANRKATNDIVLRNLEALRASPTEAIAQQFGGLLTQIASGKQLVSSEKTKRH